MALQSILAVGLIALILASCSLSGFAKNLIGASTSATSQQPFVQNNSSPAPANPSNLSKVDQQWAQITQAEAEKVLLIQAKKLAVKQGYSDAVVFGCTCTPNENGQIKSYDCSVSAIDGSHKASIVCIKTQDQCIVTSEKGTNTYNFDQLQAFINGS